MSYAVVRFVKEGDDNEEIVSEIPIGWLSTDQKKCKWPPNNSNIYISKNRPAADSWLEYDVEVEYICENLVDAKLKARSCSSDEEGKTRGKGCRAPKPLKVYSPPISSCRKGTEELQCLPPLLEHGYADYFVKRFSQANPIDDQQLEDNSEVFIVTNFESGSETPSDLGGQQLQMKVSKQTQTDDMESPSSIDIRPLLDSIMKTQIEHSLCLEEIKQNLGKKETLNEDSKVTFNYELPCNTLESLEGLELYLNEHSSQFVKLLQKIGGNDGRDFTCRCLKTVFTNSLGEICSWTGQKSNFAINKLKTTELIFDAVSRKSSITKREFEFYTKEWFRHSKQRKEREDKKK